VDLVDLRLRLATIARELLALAACRQALAAESGEAAPRLAQIANTTFDAQVGVAAEVARENPHLYLEIQSLNDYGTESLTALRYAVERLRSVVRAGDEAGFAAFMERGRAYLRGRCQG
jgi:chorismate mutase/prephenate dehydrogenase